MGKGWNPVTIRGRYLYGDALLQLFGWKDSALEAVGIQLHGDSGAPGSGYEFLVDLRSRTCRLLREGDVVSTNAVSPEVFLSGVLQASRRGSTVQLRSEEAVLLSFHDPRPLSRGYVSVTPEPPAAGQGMSVSLLQPWDEECAFNQELNPLSALGTWGVENGAGVVQESSTGVDGWLSLEPLAGAVSMRYRGRIEQSDLLLEVRLTLSTFAPGNRFSVSMGDDANPDEVELLGLDGFRCLVDVRRGSRRARRETTLDSTNPGPILTVLRSRTGLFVNLDHAPVAGIDAATEGPAGVPVLVFSAPPHRHGGIFSASVTVDPLNPGRLRGVQGATVDFAAGALR
jgi:hypothetical protein